MTPNNREISKRSQSQRKMWCHWWEENNQNDLRRTPVLCRSREENRRQVIRFSTRSSSKEEVATFRKAVGHPAASPPAANPAAPSPPAASPVAASPASVSPCAASVRSEALAADRRWPDWRSVQLLSFLALGSLVLHCHHCVLTGFIHSTPALPKLTGDPFWLTACYFS
ncbi:PREDICTED: uncharacterized protein LOC105577244 isoform X1 [Cercocebus atys]|uniref:uncharacterized protein LOC105577244 isoform X1 n=1 Tax=Cercocebus atys TaxID=9531 RepID=UPI0005F419FE|nr:PREDICTED: uncharacterized protein LOC105577244 isoform X1 [Cercocebus atys]